MNRFSTGSRFIVTSLVTWLFTAQGFDTEMFLDLEVAGQVLSERKRRECQRASRYNRRLSGAGGDFDSRWRANESILDGELVLP